MIELSITKRTDERLLQRMAIHYSQPKGFVGRNICYAVHFNNEYYGHIVAGSSTKHLPNRHEFLGTDSSMLNNIVNNIFFNITPVHDKYPMRNFTTKVLLAFEQKVKDDWHTSYGDKVVGFESLVLPPRTGDLYKKAGWELVGMTKGYTCKRVGGESTDSWGGRRVWNYTDLKPKLVFCKRAA